MGIKLYGPEIFMLDPLVLVPKWADIPAPIREVLEAEKIIKLETGKPDDMDGWHYIWGWFIPKEAGE